MSSAEPHTPVGPLGGLLRRGAALSAVALVVVQAVSLLQTLVVARILSPADIGVVAAATVLTGFLQVSAEGGLRHALIQRETDLDDAADTVFRATLLTGAVLTLASLAVAPLLGAFFDSRTVGLVAAASSGTLLLHALTNVPDALLQRRFDFRRRLVVDPAVAVSYAVVAVALAVAGLGVWSLVVASYASALTWVVASWALGRYRPGRGTPSVRLWRELARFSAPIVVDGLADRARGVAETAVVGRALDVTALGHYRYGKRLSMLPGVAVVQICAYVLFPAFSRIADDPERLRSAFLRALQWIWAAAAPAAALLVALGEPAVVVLLGEQWRAAGVAMVAMAGYGLGEALNSVSGEAVKGAGRSDLLYRTTVVSVVAGIGLLVALLPLGLVGVGLAISTASVVVGVYGVVLALPVVRVRGREALRSTLPAAAAAAVAGVGVGLLEHLVVHADQHGVLAGLLLLALETALGGLLYLAALRVLAPSLVSAVLGAVRRRARRGRP